MFSVVSMTFLLGITPCLINRFLDTKIIFNINTCVACVSICFWTQPSYFLEVDRWKDRRRTEKSQFGECLCTHPPIPTGRTHPPTRTNACTGRQYTRSARHIFCKKAAAGQSTTPVSPRQTTWFVPFSHVDELATHCTHHRLEATRECGRSTSLQGRGPAQWGGVTPTRLWWGRGGGTASVVAAAARAPCLSVPQKSAMAPG
jgi:hypothetical protein